jgi:hypothetical protein
LDLLGYIRRPIQLAAVVPPSDKGKILGQPKDLETANLVDIHNATFYYT